MLRTVLLIILILALLGSFPLWPYSAGWGYYPSGGLGLILLVVLVLALFRRSQNELEKRCGCGRGWAWRGRSGPAAKERPC